MGLSTPLCDGSNRTAVSVVLRRASFNQSSLFLPLETLPEARPPLSILYCNNVVIMTPHDPSKLFASDIALFDDVQLDQYLEANGRLKCRTVEFFTLLMSIGGQTRPG